MKEIQIAHQKLTIHELDDVCDSATGRALTGSWLWNSALVLAEWLATQSQLHHFDFHSKSVIELGAGTGLPGLTAALLGASRVVLTDVELLLPGLLRNVEANGLGDRVEVRQLVWKSEDSAGRTERFDKFDVVLMSDVFFDQEEMGPLADTIRRLCRRDTKIWGAAEVRPWTGECLNEFASRGFEVAELAIELGLTNSFIGEGESEVIAIFNLTPPQEEKPGDGLQERCLPHFICSSLLYLVSYFRCGRKFPSQDQCFPSFFFCNSMEAGEELPQRPTKALVVSSIEYYLQVSKEDSQIRSCLAALKMVAWRRSQRK